MLHEDRPDDLPEVAVAVELRDGRRIKGRVRTFSIGLEDSRELALIGPLSATAGPAAPSQPMTGDFIVLREEQIASVTGNYIPRQPKQQRGQGSEPDTAPQAHDEATDDQA